MAGPETNDPRGTVLYEKVYIHYPRGVRTGGPELLHQLCHVLRTNGVQAFMVPTADSRGNPRVTDYQQYESPESQTVVDAPGTAVVASEYLPLSYSLGLKRADPIMWWMSVDNSRVYRWTRRLQNWQMEESLGANPNTTLLKRRAAPIYSRIESHERRRLRLNQRVRHVTQSEYAAATVRVDLGKYPEPLSDYINLPSTNQNTLPRRPRTLVYNASKGKALFDLVAPTIAASGWEAQPIQGMSSAEVSRVLHTASVYLDLGHHPGMDRLPREAAASGAVVILAARGSGAFLADTPVGEEFRLSVSRDLPRQLSAALDRVDRDPLGCISAQNPYRSIIESGRDRFEKEALQIFSGASR